MAEALAIAQPGDRLEGADIQRSVDTLRRMAAQLPASYAQFVRALGLAHINGPVALAARQVNVGSASWRPTSAIARVT